MSIPIEMTISQYNKIKRQLQTKDKITCLDKQSHIRVTLVALELLKTGQDVKAQIIKGYK